MEIASSNFLDTFFTVHRLKVCRKTHFDNFVIKAGFHRLWLFDILQSEHTANRVSSSVPQGGNLSALISLLSSSQFIFAGFSRNGAKEQWFAYKE